jgi:hypothetical protein
MRQPSPGVPARKELAMEYPGPVDPEGTRLPI